MVLALCLTSGVARGQPATAGVADDADSVLRAEWTGPCDQADRPFFALDFYANGVVRYVGGELMREIGERSMTIGERAVRRLVARAKRIARGSEDEIGDAPPRLPYDHCVRITMHNDGEAVQASLSSREPKVVDFALTIDTQVRFAPKVCPPRGGDATPFSAANYCPEPSATLHLQSDGNCLGLHVVDAYEDGTVHYYASEVAELEGQSTRIYFDDSYDQVGTDVVDELVELVQSFQAFRMGEHSTQFRYGTREELLRFRDRIDAVTTFEWAEISAVPECPAMVDSYARVNR